MHVDNKKKACPLQTPHNGNGQSINKSNYSIKPTIALDRETINQPDHNTRSQNKDEKRRYFERHVMIE